MTEYLRTITLSDLFPPLPFGVFEAPEPIFFFVLLEEVLSSSRSEDFFDELLSFAPPLELVFIELLDSVLDVVGFVELLDSVLDVVGFVELLDSVLDVVGFVELLDSVLDVVGSVVLLIGGGSWPEYSWAPISTLPSINGFPK